MSALMRTSGRLSRDTSALGSSAPSQDLQDAQDKIAKFCMSEIDRLLERKLAALGVLQRGFRTVLARSRINRLRKQRIEETNAAVLIQKTARMFLCRNDLEFRRMLRQDEVLQRVERERFEQGLELMEHQDHEASVQLEALQQQEDQESQRYQDEEMERKILLRVATPEFTEHQYKLKRSKFEESLKQEVGRVMAETPELAASLVQAGVKGALARRRTLVHRMSQEQPNPHPNPNPHPDVTGAAAV
eukprot:TRINITY_DN4075_c0_g1_i2.p1 TRINITY_DN4075_c0_g1~~TRINITY_DN4075_c0_g1_i2.p1  ORF type:complete len:246 (-),score=57.88 TRINITY_DN4075_c0_g1_i2:843-1580(-)